jgi:hypothetical protein
MRKGLIFIGIIAGLGPAMISRGNMMDLPPNKKMDPKVSPVGDATLEQWLRDEVIAGHQEYLADPSQAVPVEDVLARIKARRAAR